MSNNKEFGQFFTPPLVAKFMVELISKEKDAKILEPCAGEGVFLQALSENGFLNVDAYEIDNTLNNNSSLKIEYIDYLSINSAKKYDVIIGNPPYVRWKNIPDTIKTNLQNNQILHNKINGLVDLLYAFIYLGVEKLTQNGELIFITPHFWTSTLHSQFLRKFLTQNGNIDILLTFHEMKIFKNVSSNIIIFKFIKEKKERPVRVIHIKSKSKLTTNNLEKVSSLISVLSEKNYFLENEYEAYLHPQNKNGNPWIFLPPKIEPILETMENKCINNAPIISINSISQTKIPLSSLLDKNDLEEYDIDIKICNKIKFGNKNYYAVNSTTLNQFENENIQNIQRYIRLGDVADIGNGLVSGLDEAFRIENITNLTDEEKNYLVKVVKAKNLDRYNIKGFTYYLFLNELKDEPNIEKYPNISKKLLSYIEPLKKRYSYKKNIPYWHWVFLRNYDLIKNNHEKIIVPCKERIDKRHYIRFALTNGEYLATQDTTVIVKNNSYKEDIKYFLAILNSKIIFQWIQHKGLIRGGVFEFSEKPLSIIPIRLINWEDKSELELYNEIILDVDSLITNGVNVENIENIEKNICKLYGVDYIL